MTLKNLIIQKIVFLTLLLTNLSEAREPIEHFNYSFVSSTILSSALCHLGANHPKVMGYTLLLGVSANYINEAYQVSQGYRFDEADLLNGAAGSALGALIGSQSCKKPINALNKHKENIK